MFGSQDGGDPSSQQVGLGRMGVPTGTPLFIKAWLVNGAGVLVTGVRQ